MSEIDIKKIFNVTQPFENKNLNFAHQVSKANSRHFEFSFKISKHCVKVGENSCICNLHHTLCCNYFEMDKEKPIIY